MATTQPELKAVELDAGRIHYRESGSGPAIVFAHGLLVDGTLWRKVTPLLADRFRCVVPDLPLGSHREPMRPDADLTPPGVARILADFLASLDLQDVTLVGNDTGGAISQIVAANHPERLGRLVLTPCDAYENFLPPFFRPLQYAARVPGLLTALVQPMRLRVLQRGPLGFGLLISPDAIEPDVLDSWIRPFLSDGGIRRDTVEFLRSISNRYTLEAAEEVCATGAIARREIVDLLARLVDKSLVSATGRRFRLLDTIRQYAAERLAAAAEHDTVAVRHLDWCLALAQEHDPLSAGPRRSLRTLETEHDNLRAGLTFALRRDPQAALRLATSLWRFWLDRGYFVEGDRWLEATLVAAPELTALRVCTPSGRTACRAPGPPRTASRFGATCAATSPTTGRCRWRCGPNGS